MPERIKDRGYVVTRARYADFEITFEFYPEAETNSGVFVRCRDAVEITPEDCYEFNIWDAHEDPDRRTGAIIRFSPPATTVLTEDKWNTGRIRLEGSRLRYWVNGTLTNDIEDSKLAEGHIALQFGGNEGMVKFRNIRIEALD